MSSFNDFAGQLIASGVEPLVPLVDFEEGVDYATLQGMDLIRALTPKISQTRIMDVQIFPNPLRPMIDTFSVPLGVGLEEAGFVDGTPNIKKQDGCMPRGDQIMASTLEMINYAENNSVTIKDREVSLVAANVDTVTSYFQNKMRLPDKKNAQMRYAAWKQKLSDVIDGTRSVNSFTASDGTGTTVTYSPTVKGYAGSVLQENVVLPAAGMGQAPAFASSDDVVELITDLEINISDMGTSDNPAYTKAGISGFLASKPYTVLESKTLIAMNKIMRTEAADKGFPTRTARQILEEFTNVVVIDKFADMPTNASYAGQRLFSVTLPQGAMREGLVMEGVRQFDCANEWSTGFNFRSERLMYISKMVPSFAMTVKTA